MISLFLLSTNLFAADRFGSDAIRNGSKTTLTGVLLKYGNNWAIEVEENRYNIRFGNRQFLNSIGIPLEAGAEVTVYGVLRYNQIAPIIVVLYPEAYSIRHTDGKPFWLENGLEDSAIK